MEAATLIDDIIGDPIALDRYNSLHMHFLQSYTTLFVIETKDNTF